jgi:hypothetical protein
LGNAPESPPPISKTGELQVFCGSIELPQGIDAAMMQEDLARKSNGIHEFSRFGLEY